MLSFSNNTDFNPGENLLEISHWFVCTWLDSLVKRQKAMLCSDDFIAKAVLPGISNFPCGNAKSKENVCRC